MKRLFDGSNAVPNFQTNIPKQGEKGLNVRAVVLRVGPFDENMAISLDSLKAMTHSPAAFEHLMPVETALDDIPALDLEEAEANMLRRGQAVPVFRAADRERLGGLREGDVLYTVHDGLPVAISRIKGGCVWPIRVLNL